MSLKSKLSPETRLALRIANALKSEANPKPKGILRWLGGDLLVPVLIGLGIGLGTNYFQAQESLSVWKAEHKAEVESKLSAIRADVLTSFQQTITEYFSFDMETSVELNFLVFQKAVKLVIPDFNTDAFKNLPSFPTTDQIKESSRIWSKLEALSQSVKVYFGDKIGSEASSLLLALNAEPTNTLDIRFAVEQLQKLKAEGKINFENISAILSPYLSPPRHHSPHLEESLRNIGLDMQCLIARRAEIEPDLISTTCQR